MPMDDPVYKGPQEIDLEQAVIRSTIRNARLNMIGAILLFLLALGLNFVLFKALTSEFPRNRTVYTSNAAAVCNFVPVDQPGTVSAATVRNFAQKAVEDLHTLDFMNWRKTLDRVTADRFTPEARAAATEALRRSGILPSIINNNYVLRPVVNDVVQIRDEGVVDGVYRWTVEVPIILAYTGASRASGVEYRPENRVMRVTVERTEITADSPEGLLVSALFSTQAVATSDAGTN